MKSPTTTRLLTVCLLSALGANAQKTATLTINANQGRKQISPYIYGTNDPYDHAGARRFGGNRTTSYNWENNASNAGHDWRQNSDDWLPWHFNVDPADYEKPGATIKHYHNISLNQGGYTIATLPMAGYVAKDKNGEVHENEAAPSSRWAKVVARKNAPFSLQPNLNDDEVYVDEEINFLLTTFGSAATATGIKAYSLDNEPCLWPSSHQRLWNNSQGTRVKYLMDKSFELASLIKTMDPAAEVYGPALYGFLAYQNLQLAPDWDSIRGSHNYFIEYYLAKMRERSQQENRRLLDVLDLHWYPETNADFGGVSPFNNNSDRNSVAARLEMTRSLWDSTYRENTWIGREHHQGILPLLPKLQNIINTNYPGTKLAITEYSYMGMGHISGAIAQADALGIFGRHGLYLATYWGEVSGYIKSGFDIYRNYDGNGGTFGDVALGSNSNKTFASVYASVDDNDESKLHAIAINKDMDSTVTATIAVNSARAYRSARVWILDNKGTNIRSAKNVRVINNNSFEYKLPPMTIAHFVLTEEDLSIHPFVDSISITSAAGYSDGKASFTVNATILDADNNMDSVYVDLSPVGGSKKAMMAKSGDNYSLNFTVPVNAPSGLKDLLVVAKDAQGNRAEEHLSYRVIKKLAPAVIWDGDLVTTGEGSVFHDPSDSHAHELSIERLTTGGNKKPGSLSMHFAHDEHKWNVFCWRFDGNPAGAKNISEYGFLEFYIKSNAPAEADFEISLRDASANMTTSNTIMLKAGGYLSSFSSKYYTRVRVPISAFTTGNDIDLTRVWQMNFSCNTAVNGIDVWVDDIVAYPYTNTAVQPKFTNVVMTPAAGYADNQTVVTITAETTDPDSNIRSVMVDLSGVDRQNNKTLTLANGKYTGTFTVPLGVVSGKKSLNLSVTDANYNFTDSLLSFTVHPKASTEVIWDGDNIATGTFELVGDMGGYSIDSTGGKLEPKVMKLRLQHSAQNPFCAVLLDWNANTGNTRRIDMSDKRFLNFYLKTSAVASDFDLMLIIKDQYANEARPVWLKQSGYVQQFTGDYQLVRIPLADIMPNTNIDVHHVTRIGFLSVRSLNGTDVYVDDVTVSGSSVADVRFSMNPSKCGANGSIKVDSVGTAGSGNFNYYIKNRLNPAGATNPEFTKLLPGAYDVMVKGDNGFVYIETLTLGGSTAVTVTGVTDSAGNVDITAKGGSGQYSYSWTNGMTSEDLTGLASGSYRVTVTDTETGCAAARTFSVINQGLTLKVYPNPATTYVNIEFSATETLTAPLTVTLVNKFGTILSSKSYTNGVGKDKFTFSNLTPDVYYIIVNMNGKTYSRNFMVN